LQVFSGGARPYEGLSCDQTVIYVAEGGRLARPDNCPLYVHQLMRRCWAHRPADRPSARQIFNLLADAATSRDCDVTHVTSPSPRQVRPNTYMNNEQPYSALS